MTRMLISSLLVVAPMCFARAEFDTNGWTWMRPITMDKDQAGFVRLPIADEVFDETQPSLQDLRIIGADGNLVPHIISWKSEEDATQTKWRAVSLINAVYQPESHSSITLDFGASTQKNLIRVELSETNFRRRVSIEGSADNANWSLVVENKWLFDIHQENQSFVVNSITFPVNDFRYLRLTVHYMADDPRQVIIHSVESALQVVVEKKSLVPVSVAKLETSRDEKTGETVIDVDLGHKNLPVAVVGVQITGDYFYRGFSIRGRNSLVEKVQRKTELGFDTVELQTPWEPVRQGVFYRVIEEGKTDEQTTIERLGASHRYLQIRIDNGDNPPLTIPGVYVLRRDAGLVFSAKPTEFYSLVGGNPSAPAPKYDLARSMVDVAKQDLPTVRLAASTRLTPVEKPIPWTERNAPLIWVVLIGAVGAMAAVLLASLKSIGKKEVQPEGEAKRE